MTFNDLHFPPGEFRVHDPEPDNHHSALYLVFPGGLMVNVSSDDRVGVDQTRAEWMAAHLNLALARERGELEAETTAALDGKLLQRAFGQTQATGWVDELQWEDFDASGQQRWNLAATWLLGALRAALAPPDRDAMARRTEEEWDALEEAIATVYALRAGHTLSTADITALALLDKCHRDDEEGATEAYHRGRDEGLVERGGDELLQLVKREEKAFLDKLTERTLKVFAQQRATRAEAAVKALGEALRLAKSHLEHQGQWIAAKATGYSFEALGEDMGAIDEALALVSATQPEPAEPSGPGEVQTPNGEQDRG